MVQTERRLSTGNRHEPRNMSWVETTPELGTYGISAWIFLRVLGLIYLVAFVSLALQIRGLSGKNGIVPASEVMDPARESRVRGFWRLPTLCWIGTSDRFLLFLTWGGAILAVMLAFGFAPLPDLILLWLFYLSLFPVCRPFLSYQWDVLLLETGFLAIFLGPTEILPCFPPHHEPPRIVIWLFWLLLFRLMFSSGIVKLRSRDPTWRNRTALCYHYQTQPLPTPLAWYLHQFPQGFHKLSASLVFAIELGCPILMFAPAPLRYIAAGLFIALMILIEATGNYCFFNLLGIALSLLLFEDRVWTSIFQVVGYHAALSFHSAASPFAFRLLAVIVAPAILLLSVEALIRLFHYEILWPKQLGRLVQFLTRFYLVNGYGLFALMTTERPEISVEGSDDGVNWVAYEFKWKPGNPKRAPPFVAPHQPRLDWQMWFAALGRYENNPWFIRFLIRLLEGSPAVLGLLRQNPFPEHPPRYVRGVMYDYRFSTPAERKPRNVWWRRERREIYCPPLELADVVAGRGQI
jgi:lipase maturation factor 1